MSWSRGPTRQHAADRIILIIEDDRKTATRTAKSCARQKYQPAIARTPMIATQLMTSWAPLP